MRFLITGCAGFIGSHVTDHLLAAGHIVTGIDNFSTGRLDFLKTALGLQTFNLITADLLKPIDYSEVFAGIDFVFHFAANADVRFGLQHPDKDLQQNTIATFNVLEAMRKHKVARIGFASTGSVYGEANEIPTPENAAFPIQTSLYGASKLAAEGLIAAYAEGFGIQAYIFRFVSILGERYSHGHVYDFFHQLALHPAYLTILGNGEQRKSYLYVQDCIAAMMLAINKSQAKIQIYNLGTNAYCTVNDSIQWICNYLKINPRLEYTGGARGWVGDNPFIYLNTQKIQELGWQAKLSIEESVNKTIQYLAIQSTQLEKAE